MVRKPHLSLMGVKFLGDDFMHQLSKKPVLFGLRTPLSASFFLCAALLIPEANAQVSVSGFGSIVAGKVTTGDGYIANYTELGIYGKNGSAKFGPTDQSWLNQETRFGIQASMNINESTRATAQIVARGTQKYSPNVEWLFVTHEVTSNLNVQAGKLRVPVYLYSDKMDVGFAYPWLRVPADTYSLDTVSFNGGKVNYDFTRGEFSLKLSAWAGTSDEQKSRLMSYLFGTTINRYHRFTGVVADSIYGPFQVRASYTADRMDQSTPDPMNAFRNEKFDEKFIDLALQYQLGDFTFVAEWNQDKPFYKSDFQSVIYQFGVNSVYLTKSKFVLDEPWEQHHTTSIGLRREIGSNMSVKFDLTRMTDQGKNPFTGGTNPVIQIRPGHATTASVSFDFIF